MQRFGRYELLKTLGRGGMGDASLARPTDPSSPIPTPVVVKRLHAELAVKPTFVERFRHEAQLAVWIESPHLAAVYDAGKVGETLYYAMEYVPGLPLSTVMSAALKAKVRFPIEAAIDLIGAALLGAHALHEAKNVATGEALGIVHRDLSPRNLLVGRGGALKLIDLGLGKSTQQDWRTATGIVMGTMGYLSPEQAMGADVDRRADLYTLAVVLFEMLTLERYIPKGQHMSMVEAQIRPRAISARSLRPELPEALDLVLLRALSPQRDDRFSTAMELRSALLSVVPEASLGDAGSRLIHACVGTKLDESDREVEQVLQMPRGDDVGAADTVVFVDRTKLERGPTKTEARFQTSFSNVPDTLPTPPPTMTAQRVMREEIEPVRSRGISLPTLVGAVVGSSLLSFVAAAIVFGDRGPAPAITVDLPTVSTSSRSSDVPQARAQSLGPQEGPQQGPRGAPRGSPELEPGAAIPKPAAPSRVERPAAKPRPGPMSSPEPLTLSPKPLTPVTTETLMARAVALRERLPESARAEIDLLRARLIRAQAAADDDVRKKLLDELADELMKLESRGPR